MLQLKNIVKTYDVGDNHVHALRGLSIDFRESEFVSILGPSGCGKTTLLNIVGGLDRYTEGDLLINGKSTKDFKDSDWDTYRNHSVGFVFQSYNLIPHQTVLANVELALTLSGVSKAERRRRATEALEKVGLGDQLKKKPNQMSGGQMQRVAIARAIVNDPDILLADEPTGALDTQTSIQIMEILKEIAKDKLVIMVTHNPELAETYSSRIVKLLDGQIIGDTHPFTAPVSKEKVVRKTQVKKGKRTTMSFFTALSLSLNNLMTKKGRTFMTAFAGSIGIIGIALILSLSTGINAYIDTVQKDTLSSYPIEINKQTMDMASMMAGMMSDNSDGIDYESRDPNKVYANNILSDLMNTMNEGVTVNNLSAFKEFVESNETLNDKSVVSAIQYTYGMNMNIYASDTSEGVLQVNPSRVMSILMSAIGLGTDDSTMASIGSMYGLNVWTEMLNNPELLDSQYELLDESSMRWPTNYDEVVLVVDQHNELSDVALYALGLKDPAEFENMISILMSGGTYEPEESVYTFDDLMSLTYRIVLPTDCYVYNEETGVYENKSEDEEFLKEQIANGIELKVVGIVRAREGAVSTSISGTVGYTQALTEYVAKEINKSQLLKDQLENSEINVLTGLEFDNGQLDNLTDEQKAERFMTYAAQKMRAEEKSKAIISLMSSMSEEEREALINGLPEETKEALMSEDLSAYTDVQLIDYVMLNLPKYPDIYQQFLLDMVELMLAPLPEDTDEIKAQKEQMKAFFDTMSDEEIIAQIESSFADTSEEEKAAQLRAVLEGMTRDMRMVYANAIAQAEMLERLTNQGGSLTEMALLFDSALTNMETEKIAALFDSYQKDMLSEQTHDQVLTQLGMVDLKDPTGIYLYAASFEGKDTIQSVIADYNATAEAEGREGDVITYTDLVGIMMSFFTDVINAVSYVLIAFVSISLIVSSIMIGIITYISVLERTKEIGILRAMGASKRDVSRVFNAETMIIGLSAGLIGILATVLMCIPINAIIRYLTGIPTLTAALPVAGGVILVIISMVLTMVAGLIPSFSAAKKDPVVALRTE